MSRLIGEVAGNVQVAAGKGGPSGHRRWALKATTDLALVPGLHDVRLRRQRVRIAETADGSVLGNEYMYNILYRITEGNR